MKSYSRLRETIIANSIRDIMQAAERMGITDYIQLQIGQPSAATPPHICEAAVRAMQEGYTRYTANAGLTSLREAIARSMRRDYRVDVPIDRIVVTAGAVSAINIALLALVDIGEEVLIPDPGYPNYEALVRMQGAHPVHYPTRAEHEYVPAAADLERLITPFTKAIIVNTPSNPTGAVFRMEHWKALLDLVKKYGLYLISDELYDGIVYEGTHISPLSVDPGLHDQIISIRGFSKVYAMTGWRLAYAIVPEKLFPLMCKLQEPVTTCASSISQKAGEAALDGPQTFVEEMREVYRANRDKACAVLDRYGMHYVKPKGAFYIPIDIGDTGLDAKSFAMELLTKHRVMVAPCNSFGPSGNRLIRICFAGDAAELERGLTLLGEFYTEKKRSTR
jgi:aspartate aminotransferase/aminotransferase